MIFFLILFFWLIPMGVGAYIGSQRDKLAAGILLPLFLGWIGVVIVACLSNRVTSINVTTVQQVNAPPADDGYGRTGPGDFPPGDIGNEVR